ncbi:MAG: alpha/beta hydrolase-fold protein [Bacteroidales bacterium]|jgi:enterochelin esterase-like enzyme
MGKSIFKFKTSPISNSEIYTGRIVLITALIVLLSGLSGRAQNTDNSKPATSNTRGALYPQITKDLRVVFQIKAPYAKKVQIQIPTPPNDVKTYDMVRDNQGVWTLTTDPQVPGFHYYSLYIDSVSVADPASMSFFGNNRMASAVEISEAGVDFYLPKNVPQGQIRINWYYSNVTGKWRQQYIYLPPDYDKKVNERYPVLYLQHGGGEDEGGWTIQGKANFIMDNLIADGKAKPMIIVMDCGYAIRAIESEPLTQTDGRSAMSAFSAYEDVMIKEIIPRIDATYRTITDRDHRAMAGLSMGGMQTIQITFGNLDKFAYIGGFSGAGRFGSTGLDIKNDYNGLLSDSTAFNKKVKLLWIGIGTDEAVNMYKSVNGFHMALLKAGIKHVYYESPGTAHEWLTWRRCLNEFAPLLFKK